jgi:hypothetical protein
MEIIEDKNLYAPVHDIGWDFPLWSEILPGLWLGGTDDDDTIETGVDTYKPRMITKDDFDTVVTLYSWAQPVDWLVEEVRYGFYDSEIGHIDFSAVERAADFAYQAWKSGKRVLIRCQAGINRSSLVMAHVLMKDKYTAREAIDLMREKRSKAVLLNKHFVDYLVMSDEVPLER